MGGEIQAREGHRWVRWVVERSRLVLVLLEEVSTKSHYNDGLTIIFTGNFD